MGFLDELIASAKTVVGKAEQQTDRVVEISKLKYQSAQLSSELKGLYEKLGQAVYAMMNDEYDNQELVNSLAEEITEVKAALAVVDEKINERMNRKICPYCSTQNAKEAVFCMKCGVKLVPENSDEDTCSCTEESKEESCDAGCCCEAPQGETCSEGEADPDQEQTAE